MTTKFRIQIFAYGTLNDRIFRLVTNHNEGKISATLDHFKWVGKIEAACYPTITPDLNFIEDVGNKTLEVQENGKLTVTIEEYTVVELEQETAGEGPKQNEG